MIKEVSVLDHGYVKLIDCMGSDYRILEAARISTGAEPTKGDEKDRGLIRYLYRNKHLTPAEQCTFTFRIKMPIFVMRQWIRTRTASTNEMSARYREMDKEYYVPDAWRFQAEVNHQASEGHLDEEDNEVSTDLYVEAIENSYSIYDSLINDKDIAREMARFVMPVSQYTEIYWTINLRNLFHFLELRLTHHAQLEIRVYAEAILNILKSMPEFKWSTEIFEEDLKLDYLIMDLKNKYKNNYEELISKIKDL